MGQGDRSDLQVVRSNRSPQVCQLSPYSAVLLGSGIVEWHRHELQAELLNTHAILGPVSERSPLDTEDQFPHDYGTDHEFGW